MDFLDYMFPTFKSLPPPRPGPGSPASRRRREVMRTAVRYFLGHRQQQLRFLGIPETVTYRDVMRHIRASRRGILSGHWVHSYNRHLGLRQAYCALRYQALLERSRTREAA